MVRAVRRRKGREKDYARLNLGLLRFPNVISFEQKANHITAFLN